MKCPKCGSEIEYGYEGECECKNKKCEYAYKKGGTSYASIGEEWQARAEKAEGELKAIKDRIEALSEAQPKYLHLSSDNTDWESSFYGLRNEIKQIGGEK